MGQFFIGVVSDGAAPTVGVLGTHETSHPINGTIGAAGDTSRPYKWVDL